jgi:hypothetical protein
MYKILCDGVAIYDPQVQELKVLEPQCRLELNKSGTLSFRMHPTHPYYSSIKKLKSELTLLQDDEWVFTGRVLNDESDFNNIKTIVCEGELGYLNDSNQRQAEYHDLSVEDYFRTIIEKHNADVEVSKRFIVGSVTVTDPNDNLYRYSNYEKTWHTIEEKLIGRLGGYIRTRRFNGNRYIDYIDNYLNINNQAIDFGKNLLDLKQYVKGEDIATAIIPLGARLPAVEGETSTLEKRLTISEINDGKDYVYDEDAVALFGWIFDTVSFDDVTLPENLRDKGYDELATRKMLNFILELTALDMHLLDVDIEKYKLGDLIPVKSEPHNLENFMLCSVLDICIDDPTKTKVNLGTTVQSLTDMTNDGVPATVEKIINDKRIPQEFSAIKTFINELSSSVTQSAQNILLEVNSNYAEKSDLNSINELLRTNVEILNNLVEFKFTSAQSSTQTLEGIVTGNQQLLEEYIRFQGALIQLGQVGGAFTAELSNEKLSFKQNNVEIAYISNNKMYITDAEIRNKLTIGNPTNGYFDWIMRSNGNLAMKWRLN